MPWVRSTLTRWSGLTTVNLLVKYAETSSPRDAISAISSAVGTMLDVFGIALLFLLSRVPGRDQMVFAQRAHWLRLASWTILLRLEPRLLRSRDDLVL